MNEKIKEINQNIEQIRYEMYWATCKYDLSETDDESLNNFNLISLNESYLMERNIKNEENPNYSLQSLKKRSALKRQMFNQIEKLSELHAARSFAHLDHVIENINNLLK